MRHFCYLLIFLSLNCLAQSNDPPQVWKITSLNWPPYTSDQMTNEGNAIQHLRHLLRSHNIELLVEFYPWQRAIKMAQQPGYLGYFPAWPEEIIDGFVASKPVTYSEISLLTLGPQPIEFKDIPDLFQKYRVGFVRSYTYPDAIQTAMETYTRHTVTTLNESMLLKMFTLGRFDVAISDPLVLDYIAEKQSLAQPYTQQLLFRHPLIIGLNNHADNAASIALLDHILSSLTSESSPSK